MPWCGVPRAGARSRAGSLDVRADPGAHGWNTDQFGRARAPRVSTALGLCLGHGKGEWNATHPSARCWVLRERETASQHRTKTSDTGLVPVLEAFVTVRTVFPPNGALLGQPAARTRGIGSRDRPYLENCTVDASIFKLWSS